jgi:chitinase
MQFALALTICVSIVMCTGLASGAPRADAGDDRSVWIMPYYLSVNQQRQPPDTIDFRAFSVLIHFGLNINDDGTIDPKNCGITPAQSQAVIERAHAAGDKVTICVGSDGRSRKDTPEQADEHEAVFVRSLMQFVTNRGYDGVDIDKEPINDSDVPKFKSFVRELRAAMDATGHHLILTAAVTSEPAMFAEIQDCMDRIDLMTYDLSGPQPGNKSFYNAALYDGNLGVMSQGSAQSADAMVRQFLRAGVRPGKLCIGIAFYGYVWNGVDAPGQSVKGASVNDGADYQMIMNDYYKPSIYHWDKHALAPWLGIGAAKKADRVFCSYDNARLCIDKMVYVRRHHLGGAIIWEMSGGYDFNRPPGKRDMLLRSVAWGWKTPISQLTGWRRK